MLGPFKYSFKETILIIAAGSEQFGPLKHVLECWHVSDIKEIVKDYKKK